MRYLKLFFLLVILLVVLYFNKDITNYIIENYIYHNKYIEIDKPNQYKLNYNFKYVNDINDFKVKNKTQLVNVIYTILNNGTDSFYFYCDYDECENDVNKMTNDETFSFVNNFVHPYNSYKKIYLKINSYNKVEISFEKTYTKNEIILIENKLNEIMKKIINENMTDKEKIIAFHDYIVTNTKYDSAYIDENLNDINSPSHKATGILFYNKALCGGYADIMSIFLNKLNIPNYLISSEYHVWNALYLDNSWYHLDLTWDVPPTNNAYIKLDKFLLISDNKLNSYNTGYHNYNKSIYLEFNITNR